MATPTPTSTPTPTQSDDSSSATCTTAVPGEYGYVPMDACNAQWNYNPSYSAAIAVAVIFGILTLVHVALGVVFRKPYTWVLIMGAIWELVAFIAGALGAHDQQNSAYSIIHQLLFLLAPLWVNAFVYMTLGRMVWYFLPEKKLWIIPATRMSSIFIMADILTFLVQAAGGSMASPGADSNTIQNGLRVYTVGVALQEVFILMFTGLLVVFHRRIKEVEASGGLYSSTVNDDASQPKRPWRTLLYALYAVLGFITIRIAFRIAEFGPGIGPDNVIITHEAYGYALDAAPMIIALLLLAVFHPGRVLQGPEAQLPGRKEKKAAKRAKKQAKLDAKNEKLAMKMGKLPNSGHAGFVEEPLTDGYGYDSSSTAEIHQNQHQHQQQPQQQQGYM